MGKDLPAIELEDSGAKGAPFDPFPGGGVAELTVTRVGARQIIIDHRRAGRVSRAGRRIALVSRAVDDARAAGKTIIRSARSRRRNSGAIPS